MIIKYGKTLFCNKIIRSFMVIYLFFTLYYTMLIIYLLNINKSNIIVKNKQVYIIILVLHDWSCQSHALNVLTQAGHKYWNLYYKKLQNFSFYQIY